MKKLTAIKTDLGLVRADFALAMLATCYARRGWWAF